jgi:hypothetical protein
VAGLRPNHPPLTSDDVSSWLRAEIPAKARASVRGSTGVRGLAGFTPLHYAASRGHVAIAWLLLRAGADPNAQATDKSAPLHAAASGGHLTIVRLLHCFGARLSPQDDFGETPLHFAAKSGNSASAHSLLVLGASALVKDRLGDLPGEVASTPAVRRLLQGAEVKQRQLGDELRSRVQKAAAIESWLLVVEYLDSHTTAVLLCTGGMLHWLVELAGRHALQPKKSETSSLERLQRNVVAASMVHVSAQPKSAMQAAGAVAGQAAASMQGDGSSHRAHTASSSVGAQWPAPDRASSAAIAPIADPALASFHVRLKQSQSKKRMASAWQYAAE